VGQWVFPVGRLDRDSSGLLILTNDHRLGQDLTDPQRHLPKTYHVRVRGVPSAEALDVLREGVTLEDGTRCRKANVRALGAPRGGEAGSWLEITITEGRNRQVRRMCAMVGHDVEQLARVRIGALELGDLPPGSWRALEADDVARLRRGGERAGGG
jgi:pseudouridine synthase